MPLYEYNCSACAHRFERIVKFSDPPLKICPKCGKETIEQVISAPAVQFKGSGWYVTDYGHKNPAASSNGASATQESGSETASASKDSGSSDSGTSSASSSSSSEKPATSSTNTSGSSSSSDSGSSAKNKRPAKKNK